MWRPDEVRARVGVAIPDGPAYETVGGWVMSTLGRLPTVGDTVAADGWTARVVDMDGHRVDRVRLERDDQATPAGDDETEERS
jgi:CBS domain containing-hemolysin-like protein